MVGFLHSSTESQVLEHLTWGRERSGMQARPGSRLCDRVLFWAPKFRKADHFSMIGLFYFVAPHIYYPSAAMRLNLTVTENEQHYDSLLF